MNVMERVAAFIVNKRKAFMVLFGLAAIYCVMSINKVGVNDDLTEYLPDTTETRMGLDVMEEEFRTFGAARILVANVTYEKAQELAAHIEEIKGISGVTFYDPEDEKYEEDKLADYYKDCSALFTIAFSEEEDTELSQKAIAEIREYLADYDAYVYTTVDRDDSASLQEDMKVILAIAIVIIVAVLFFTSTTYMEIVIFMMTFGMAAVLSKGTNYIFGTVSFISNAVDIVLQLALAIDYAIILFHRFMEEKEHYKTKKALIVALSKAIPEISSSSLTTIAGMVALMLMQFGIGRDLGSVLVKAIICSMLSVFCFMPALIMMFSKQIEKTKHKNFVPKISIWGKFVVGTRFILLPVFVAVIIVGFVLSNRCHYIYDINSVVSEKKNEYIASKERIDETFETTNLLAIVVPKGDYQKEAAIVADLKKIDAVDSITALSNVKVNDVEDHVLTDKVNPREFAEIADTDIDLIRFVYRAYAMEKEEYGALIGSIDDYDISIISMIDFIYEQKETRALSLDEDVSEDIDDMYQQICDAREQLEGENYSRLVVQLTGPVEGQETFDVVDRIRAVALKQYDDVYVVGDPTSNYDLSNSFSKDNVLISVLTALFVGIILLFTFQNVGLPFMLVLTIQSSIWINFSLPYLKNETMFFISYLVVSSIQMGATIDYAIVITSRYMALRKEMESKRAAVVEALNQAFPTIITSGTIMCSAGFIIGKVTSNAVIASLGTTLGWGTLISVILVMLILPQILLVGDTIIEKSEFNVKIAEEEDEADEE